MTQEQGSSPPPPLDRPLARDAKAIQARSTLRLTQGLPFAWIPTIYTFTGAENNTGFNITTGLGIYFVSSTFYDLVQANQIESSHSVSDKNFGYHADRFVYQGNDLTMGSDTLRKGDNYYHIRLPDLQIPEGTQLTPEQLRSAMALYQHIFHEIKGKVQSKTYSAIVIESPIEALKAQLESVGSQQTAKDIFAGKTARAKHEDTQIMLLTRDAFERLSTRPGSLLEQAVDALRTYPKGEQIAATIDGIVSALRQGQKVDLAGIKQQLRSLFMSGIEGRHSDPVVSINKTDPGRQTRQRTAHFETRRSGDSKRLVRIGNVPYYNVTELPVDLDQEVEEIIAGNSQDREALLAHAILDLIDSNSLEILSQSEKTPEQILQELADQQVVLRGKRESIQTKIRSSKIVQKSIVTAAILAGLYTGGLGVDLGKDMTPPPPPEITDTASPGLPEGVPSSHLEWKIETEGGLNPTGYYIESTSNMFSDGTWHINQENPTEIQIPDTLADNTTPNLTLQRYIPLDTFGRATFRLPIRDGTNVGALTITDMQGAPIQYTAIRYADGTTEIRIDHGILQGPSVIHIQETLVEVERPESVHATTQLQQIDRSKLTPELQELLERESYAEIDRLSALQYMLQSNQVYSINPPDRYELDAVDGSPESLVNVVAGLEGSDCDTSNSQFALLSSLVDSDRLYVNIAYGYLVSGDSSALGGTRSSFLDRAARHAFTVSNYGTIFDATPRRMGTDPETQQYLEMLRGSQNGGTNPDEKWNQITNDLQQRIETSKQQREFYALLALLGLTGAGYGAYRAGKTGIRFARNHPPKETIGKLREARVLQMFSESALEDAYTFFQWLRASQGSDTGQFLSVRLPRRQETPRQPTNKELRRDLLQKLQRNIPVEDLQDYLNNRHYYETTGQLSNDDARRFRRLAQYLIWKNTQSATIQV